MDDADNLPLAEPTADAAAEESDNSTAPELELTADAETSESEPPEQEDGEDVEYDGKQYRLPKELKDALLRQQDYTRKTQEVAEHRKAFEAEQAQTRQELQLQAQTLQGHAVLASIDQQLQQFSAVDWQALIDADPVQAMKLDRQMRALQEQRSGVAQQITQAQQQAMQLQRESLAKQVQEGQAKLAREIPGWSQELAKGLAEHGKAYGFSDAEMAQIYDPRAVKVLHEAFLYRQLMAKANKQKPAAEPAKPVTVVKAKAATATTSDPSKMTDKQFAQWRRQQIAKRR